MSGQASDLRLDYFKFYDVSNQDLFWKVKLMGQFDSDSEWAKLDFLTAFANPASKNEEPLYDKHSHLNWYYLRELVPDPVRVVKVSNQFGEAKLLIGSAFAFLVPTHKIRPGSEPPKHLDHFKVYKVIDASSSPQKVVVLEDQFLTEKVEVGYPFAFAVPVFKKYHDVFVDVQNRDAHLVIYKITPRRFGKIIRVKDQFDRYELKTQYSFALGAPSKKLKWAELSGDGDPSKRDLDGPWEGM